MRIRLARFACLMVSVCGACVLAQWTTRTVQGEVSRQSQINSRVRSVSAQAPARPKAPKAEADLHLSVQVERNVVQKGNNYAYSLTVNNLGPAPATGVKFTSQLPGAMSYIVANPTQGSCFNSAGAITCNLGTIAVNEPASILVGVFINDRATLGTTLAYNASVASEQTDPQTANNQIRVNTLVSNKATIAGRVTDSQGQALSNVTINVTGSASSSRTTDAQGNYLFDELASGGNYTVTPASVGYWFDPASRIYPEFSTDQTANFVAITCQYSVSPTTLNIPSGGGNASVAVTTTARCPWTATSQSPWITITTAGTGNIGNGQLQISVASTAEARTGRIVIAGNGVAGQEVAVYQVAGSCPVPVFRPATMLTRDITPDSQPFAADFNKDGLSELLVFRPPTASERPIAIYTLEENTNGWRLWSELRAPLGALTPAAADFNGDGFMDLLLVSSGAGANATGQLYLGNGRGGWDLPDRFPLSLRPLSVQQIYTPDLNRDGRADIVLNGGGSLAFITLAQADNRADGRMLAPADMNLGSDSLLALADFTGDGDVDLLTGNGAQLRLHLGGFIGAKPPIVTQLEFAPTVYAAADFTGDNRADLLIGKDRLLDNTLSVLPVTASGKFDLPIATNLGQTLGNGTYQFIVDDFNSDARMDVMLFINAATRLFIAGDGAGRLAPPIGIELPFESRSFVAGRFTRDNSLDLFALGQGQFANQLLLYANTCGHPLLMIYGRIVESGSQRGVANVKLNLTGNKTATATTDVGGYYEFNSLPARFGYVVATESNEFDFNPSRNENTYLTKDQQFNFQARRRLAVVSAASYDAAISSDAIITIFGASLAATVQVATTAILPESLANVSVTFTDANQTVYSAKLFFVSPSQINLLTPSGLAPGAYKVTVRYGQQELVSTIRIDAIAPGLFTADASGKGLPSAIVLRVAANGRQTYESAVRYDNTRGQFVAIPIDLSNTSEQVFLLLYGTGFRNRTSLSNAVATFGGTEAPLLYAGPQGGFVGLDQLNVRIPASLRGRGDVSINVTLEGLTSNTVTLNFR